MAAAVAGLPVSSADHVVGDGESVACAMLLTLFIHVHQHRQLLQLRWDWTWVTRRRWTQYPQQAWRAWCHCQWCCSPSLGARTEPRRQCTPACPHSGPCCAPRQQSLWHPRSIHCQMFNMCKFAQQVFLWKVLKECPVVSAFLCTYPGEQWAAETTHLLLMREPLHQWSPPTCIEICQGQLSGTAVSPPTIRVSTDGMMAGTPHKPFSGSAAEDRASLRESHNERASDVLKDTCGVIWLQLRLLSSADRKLQTGKIPVWQYAHLGDVFILLKLSFYFCFECRDHLWLW